MKFIKFLLVFVFALLADFSFSQHERGEDFKELSFEFDQMVQSSDKIHKNKKVAFIEIAVPRGFVDGSSVLNVSLKAKNGQEFASNVLKDSKKTLKYIISASIMPVKLDFYYQSKDGSEKLHNQVELYKPTEFCFK